MFYQSPSPEAEPFVSIGQKVNVGDVLYYREYENDEQVTATPLARLRRFSSPTRKLFPQVLSFLIRELLQFAALAIQEAADFETVLLAFGAAR